MVLVAVCIELTGGLPSQLVHLYYIPVVVSAVERRGKRSEFGPILEPSRTAQAAPQQF